MINVRNLRPKDYNKKIKKELGKTFGEKSLPELISHNETLSSKLSQLLYPIDQDTLYALNLIALYNGTDGRYIESKYRGIFSDYSDYIGEEYSSLKDGDPERFFKLIGQMMADPHSYRLYFPILRAIEIGQVTSFIDKKHILELAYRGEKLNEDMIRILAEISSKAYLPLVDIIGLGEEYNNIRTASAKVLIPNEYELAKSFHEHVENDPNKTTVIETFEQIIKEILERKAKLAPIKGETGRLKYRVKSPGSIAFKIKDKEIKVDPNNLDQLWDKFDDIIAFTAVVNMSKRETERIGIELERELSKRKYYRRVGEKFVKVTKTEAQFWIRCKSGENYIANPKGRTGYQAYHLNFEFGLIDESGKERKYSIELQLKNREMYTNSTIGGSAHGIYRGSKYTESPSINNVLRLAALLKRDPAFLNNGWDREPEVLCYIEHMGTKYSIQAPQNATILDLLVLMHASDKFTYNFGDKIKLYHKKRNGDLTELSLWKTLGSLGRVHKIYTVSSDEGYELTENIIRNLGPRLVSPEARMFIAGDGELERYISELKREGIWSDYFKVE